MAAFQVATNAEVSSLTVPKPRSKKWHLEPVSVTKISKKDQDTREPHTVPELPEVKESHSVFSNLFFSRCPCAWGLLFDSGFWLFSS